MGVYRVEICPNNRAMCKNKECKDAAIKIAQGELRFATQVTVKEHTSWSYKHWGCVTPQQIENFRDTCDGDVDMVDGYDELTKEAQEKVQFALEHGHVPDEDWRGDVEVNRPGQKGFRAKVKAPKKKAGKKADEDDADETPKPKKKRGRAAKDDDGDEAPAPKKSRGKKAAAKNEAEDDEEEAPAPKKPRGKKAAVKDEAEDDEEDAPAPKKSRGRKAAVKGEADGKEEAKPAKPRDRKASAKKEPVEEAENASDIEVEVPKKRGRKKGVVSAANDEKPAPQKRGRKLLPTMSE